MNNSISISEHRRTSVNPRHSLPVLLLFYMINPTAKLFRIMPVRPVSLILFAILIGFSSFSPVGGAESEKVSRVSLGQPLLNPMLPVAPDCNLNWNLPANKTGIIITSGLTLGGGSFANLLDGTVGTQNGYWNTVATIANKEIFRFQFPSATVLSGIEMTRSFNIANGATYRIEGSNNGSSWTDITGTQTFSSTSSAAAYGASEVTRKLPVTGNTTAYLYYRVYGISGNSANNWISELYFGTVAKSAGLSNISNSYGANTAISTDDQITFKLNPSPGIGTYNVSVSSGSISPTSATYGAATSFTLQPGSAGAGNVTVTITDVTQNCEITQLITDPGIEPYDTDGDGVNNLVDLDDDNDGILDTVEEAICQVVDYNILANKQKITISSTAGTGGNGTVQNLLNDNLTEQVFYYTNVSIVGTELVRLQFPKPTVLTGIEYNIGNSFMLDLNAQTKIQGSNDGINWVEMSPPAQFTKVAPNNTPGVLSAAQYAHTFQWTNTTPYLYYRHLGVTGGANQTPWVYELYFQTASVAGSCDFDGDGIANRLDLDSDNDGIPDNVEAQPTLTYVSSNADSPATYATNNGINSAYLGGLTPVNTDGDACQDFFDIDSDNDNELDKTESGLQFNGVPGLNGLDSGSETADTYADVNGIVDVPKTKLPGTNPGISEVNYREIPPLKRTITVCYKSGFQYGIGGSERVNAADKLLNTANFSLTGTSTFTFKLVAFTTAFTKTGLEAAGCQIVDLGINNNDAGGSTGAYTAGEKTELINWNAASKSNVILAFQNYAGVFVSGYTGVEANTNPNSLTTLGNSIIGGPFGTVAGFDQGGGYRGAYSAVPASACVVVQDNFSPTKRTTGVIDKSTNDVYLADVDLITQLGGLTTGAAITSNTDKFFANLYHSLAKLVVFAPNDPCTYFSCAAGQNAPTLSASSISGTGSVNLSSITASNLPANTALTWHTGTPATNANKISNPATYSTAGGIFASFYDSASDCYAGSGTTTTPLTVTVITASPQADLSVSVAPATQTGNKGESLTYIVTLTNAGPATATNVVVDVPMPDPKATLLSSTATAGSYNSVTKEWTVPSLAVGSATLTFTVKVN